MRQALDDGVFPGGVLAVAHQGIIRHLSAYGYANLFTRQPVDLNTRFDLASLTKPLATTLSVMQLVQRGRLSLNDVLTSFFPDLPDKEKECIRIEDLLLHAAGMPDYRPYYKQLVHIPSAGRREALKQMLLQEPLAYEPGTRTLYSDPGFMLLGIIVEAVSRDFLFDYISESVYRPMVLTSLVPDKRMGLHGTDNVAATEYCPWRKKSLVGEVHDENAHVCGGFSGHAGLFGTAEDILKLLEGVAAAYHGRDTGGIFETEVVRRFFAFSDQHARVLGFDRPSETNSSAGSRFSQKTIGHLGYTGVSFWMDLSKDIVVVLLTNRVHPSRENEKIRTFRPILHDRVMDVLNAGG